MVPRHYGRVCMLHHWVTPGTPQKFPMPYQRKSPAQNAEYKL